MEQRRRTLARVLTWRLGGILLATLLGWLLLEDPVSGASVGLLYNAIRAATQYVHERLWLRVTWGLTAAPRGGPCALCGGAPGFQCLVGGRERQDLDRNYLSVGDRKRAPSCPGGFPYKKAPVQRKTDSRSC